VARLSKWMILYLPYVKPSLDLCGIKTERAITLRTANIAALAQCWRFYIYVVG
jgi:hypothetical protein